MIHKNSMKITKGKKYKCGRGTGAQTVPKFLLPKEYDKEKYLEIRQKLEKEVSKERLAEGAKEVKLSSSSSGQDEGLKDLHLPGVKG